MTDYVEPSLLNSMSSKFNTDTDTAEGESLLNMDLAGDKTVKWRNLANNQFASKEKRKLNVNATNSTSPSTSTSTMSNSNKTKRNISHSKVISTKEQQQKNHHQQNFTNQRDNISKDSMETDKIQKSTINYMAEPIKATTTKTTNYKFKSPTKKTVDKSLEEEESEKAVEENFKALLADEEFSNDKPYDVEEEDNNDKHKEIKTKFDNRLQHNTIGGNFCQDLNDEHDKILFNNFPKTTELTIVANSSSNSTTAATTMLLNKENIQGQHVTVDSDVGCYRRLANNNKLNENNVIIASQSTSRITEASHIALSSPKILTTSKITTVENNEQETEIVTTPSSWPDLLIVKIENENSNSNNSTEYNQHNLEKVTVTEIITINADTKPLSTTTSIGNNNSVLEFKNEGEELLASMTDFCEKEKQRDVSLGIAKHLTPLVVSIVHVDDNDGDVGDAATKAPEIGDVIALPANISATIDITTSPSSSIIPNTNHSQQQHRQQLQQKYNTKELTSTDKTYTRSDSVSPLRNLRRPRHSSQNLSEQDQPNSTSTPITSSKKSENRPDNSFGKLKTEVHTISETNSLHEDFEEARLIPSSNMVKRGRGRQRKHPLPMSGNDIANSSSQILNEKQTSNHQIESPNNTINHTEKKVGRKRKQVESEESTVDISIKLEEDDIDKDNSSDGKKMRRSVRLGKRYDGFKILDEIIQEPVPQIEMSVSQVALNSLETEQVPLKIPPAKKENEKAMPKKRGRKAKNNTSNFRENSRHPSPLIIRKRPKRQIKPTPKVLENEELRLDFETKNIVRITANNLENSNGSLKSNINEQQFETPPHQIVPFSDKTPSSSKQKSEKNDISGDNNRHQQQDQQHHPSGSSAIKKKLFTKQQADMASMRREKARSAQKTCPDIDKFMNDLKNWRVKVEKSPDDKKLNKKQLRKKTKEKERFFKGLLLMPKAGEENSDGGASNSDNDEFVPPKGVQVGKPSVTLRQRTTPQPTPLEHVAAVTTRRTNSTMPISIATTASVVAVSNTASATGTTTITATATPKVRRVQQRQERTSTSNPSASQEEISVEQLQRLNNAASIASSRSSPNNTPKPKAKRKRFICLCHKNSNYYIRNSPENSFCCAIDSIEDQKVGCCNQLTGDVLNLYRPSQRIGYMMLCDDHKKRLYSHNCCAGCGIFCTQGRFILCKEQHFFHSECAQKFILNSPYDPEQPTGSYASPTLVLKCPHCGVDTPERTSIVTMKCQTLPVFLPSQTTNLPTSQPIPGAQMPSGSPLNAVNSNQNKTINSSNTQGAQTTSVHRSLTEPIKFEQLIPESVMNVVTGQKRRNTSTEFTTRELYFAIKNDDLERVAEILASDDMMMVRRECLNGNCLHLVAYSGTVQMAFLLLRNGYANEFIDVLDSELRTPSMCAILGDRCDILNLFIHCGADLTVKGPDGKSCLHYAAKLGNLEATQLLVDSFKSTKNIPSFLKFINAQDDGGWTPMVWAAELGHTDIVSYLLNHDADPDICDTDNNTVLHWATLHNESLETIKVLLQAGADCNVQNIEGDTPLHIACRLSSTRLCLALIANGADLMLRNKANELPYDCIPNEETECAKTVDFNMQMRSLGPMGLRSRVVSADISNGRESCPIKAIRSEHSMDLDMNGDESDDSMWLDFRYITSSIIFQNNIQIDHRVSQMRICSCLDGCSSEHCQCTGASQQNWYTSEGRLISDFNYDDPADIFECNDVCGCNKISCKNRIVQNGIRVTLQIIECDDPLKGWGVRTLVNIPKGSFISIYCGEILTEIEATRRTDHSYFYDLGHQHYIDGKYYGNISRFYNHSCDPNIVPVRVFYEHQDYRFPKIAFFACRDIEIGEELCYDYGDRFWITKNYSCKCGSINCRFNINCRDENSQSSSSLGTSTSGSTAATVGSTGSSHIPQLMQIQETFSSLNN